MSISRSADEIERGRDKINTLISSGNHRELFMTTCCQFYARALNEGLGLPLFFECPDGRDDLSHVFVMKGKRCFDFEGEKDIAVIAKNYGEWPDVPPRPLTLERIKSENAQRGLSDWDDRIMTIARKEFITRKHLYHP